MARFTGGSGGGSGTPGPRGPEGDSAYEVAVANGFVGTEQEWLDSLGGSGTADIADFVFEYDEEADESTMTITNHDMLVQVVEDGGRVASLRLDTGDRPVQLFSYKNESVVFTNDWSNAIYQDNGYGSGEIVLTEITSVAQFLDTEFFSNGTSDQKVLVNNGTPLTIIGYSSGSGNATLTVIEIPDETTTVTTLEFKYAFRSGIDFDYDDDELSINFAQGDVRLEAGENVVLVASEDIQFYARAGENEYSWSMDEDGKLKLPAEGYISNPFQSSGDGNGYSTIQIVPDPDRYEYDQYLIIDPTQPNHIHIRAGGTQDASQAELILGAERTNVVVNDGNGQVSISSKTTSDILIFENVNSEPGNTFTVNEDLTYLLDSPRPGTNFIVDGNTRYNISGWSVTEGVTNIVAEDFIFQPNIFYGVGRDYGDLNWTFTNYGYLTGPADGALAVQGLLGPSAEIDFEVVAPTAVVLNGQFGEFLASSGDPNNQIATLGDISSSLPVETSFTVNGGTLGTQPTFDGAPLFSGTYVKTGPLVHFQIQVDMDNITNFGTGQYYVDLPLPAKYGYQVREGCLHDISADKQYAIGGHVAAGQSRLNLFFTDTNGQDQEFDHNSPVTLAVADNFHVSGTYITAE